MITTFHGNSDRQHLPPLIVVLGYNAIGKSKLGIDLAKKYNGEIVSADSRQVYKRLDLGTAKVSLEEQRIVPHHLIDVAEINQVFSLGEYQKHAFQAIDDILTRGKLPFMVGGTGLYIWSVVDNLAIPSCPPDEELRSQLETQTTKELILQLQEVDPTSANNHDLISNRRRIIRALEVSLKTGRPFSAQRLKGKPQYDALQIGLTMPFGELFQKIDRRVDLRFKLGMVDEVRKLLQDGATPEWMHYLGLEYRHISKYLMGEVGSFEELSRQLKENIHQFAKKQKKWFSRDNRINWLEVDDNILENASSIIDAYLSSKSTWFDKKKKSV